MKITITILALFFSVITYSQNKGEGYAHAGFSLIGSEKLSTRNGVFIGMGVKTGAITTGLSADVHAFSDKKLKFIVAAFDVRAFIDGLQKPVSPFVAAQPGYVFTTGQSGTIKTKGGFSFAGLVGMRIKPSKKGPGFIFGLGYQLLTFRTQVGSISDKSQYGAVKLNVGISI